MARDLVLATFAAVIALGMAAGASAQDMKRCDQLAAYYDRYGGRVSEGRMPTHRLERELGYQKCRSGDFAGGAKLLEEAIRKSGYNVPAG